MKKILLLLGLLCWESGWLEGAGKIIRCCRRSKPKKAFQTHDISPAISSDIRQVFQLFPSALQVLIIEYLGPSRCTTIQYSLPIKSFFYKDSTSDLWVQAVPSKEATVWQPMDFRKLLTQEHHNVTIPPVSALPMKTPLDATTWNKDGKHNTVVTILSTKETYIIKQLGSHQLEIVHPQIDRWEDPNYEHLKKLVTEQKTSS